MSRIDRKKLRDNIIYFGSVKGLRIGDIEKSIGRRLGIISRWENKNPRTIPLDDIYNIAILLGITIDELINTDINVLIKQQEILTLKEQREMLDRQIKELEGENND